ncbi:MAG: hypothetical protein AB7E79_09890 [Rhodospirillaceae bacterium]
MKAFRFAALAAVALAGCRGPLTLEEAQARCAAAGGLLTIIYTQQITASGIGSPVESPGECVSPSKFEVEPAPSSAAAN